MASSSQSYVTLVRQLNIFYETTDQLVNYALHAYRFAWTNIRYMHVHLPLFRRFTYRALKKQKVHVSDLIFAIKKSAQVILLCAGHLWILKEILPFETQIVNPFNACTVITCSQPALTLLFLPFTRRGSTMRCRSS